MKTYNYDDMLKEQLNNPAFRKEYDALEDEFEVAKQIIELRLKQKMTQKELAKRVQTSQSCIARLESGNYRNLSLSFLRRVGGALGVRPHVTFQKSHFRATSGKGKKTNTH
jgi:DNA-binding XRE family transcriptional regulator